MEVLDAWAFVIETSYFLKIILKMSLVVLPSRTH